MRVDELWAPGGSTISVIGQSSRLVQLQSCTGIALPIMDAVAAGLWCGTMRNGRQARSANAPLSAYAMSDNDSWSALQPQG
jgi:hypothetical protein